MREVTAYDRLDTRCYDRHTRFRGIDTIVLHTMYDGSATGEDRFRAEGVIRALNDRRVSAHAICLRDGTVIHLVRDRDIAHHAGVSRMLFDGRTDVNKFSLGIELVSARDTSPTEAQYISLVEYIAQKRLLYPISSIIGHDTIARERTENFRDDPWNFDWARIRYAFPGLVERL